MQQREERLADVFNFIERDLELLGATGVEDKYAMEFLLTTFENIANLGFITVLRCMLQKTVLPTPEVLCYSVLLLFSVFTTLFGLRNTENVLYKLILSL